MATMRSLRIGPLFLALVVALATVGIGYGLWTSSLTIRDEIRTGSISGEFERAFTDDDGTVDVAALDGNDVGECAVQAGGNTSCDPAASGPDPKNRYEKDVAACFASVLADDPTAGEIKKENVYPGYFCTAWFELHNTGAIPFRIAEATVNGVPITPSVATPFDLDGDSVEDVAVHLTGIDLCQQVDPQERILMDVDQEILQGAPQNATLEYEIKVVLQQWNEECAPTTAKTLTVTQAGLTDAQVASLASFFDIPADQMVVENGMVSYVDPVGFQAVPTEVTEGAEDEEGEPTIREVFLFDVFNDIVPMPGDAALAFVSEGLRKASALPAHGSAIVEHSMFEAVDRNGEEIASALIDTRVAYRFSHGGLPFIGPGAQVSMSFDPQGKTTALTYAAYGFAEGQDVPIIPPSEATHQCADLYRGLDPFIRPALVYYAPASLGEGAPIVPHYDCGGTVAAPNDTVNLLRRLIPAVAEGGVAPQVELTVEVDGALVNAVAKATGGTAPYSYSWTSSSTDLSHVDPTESQVEYNVVGRTAAAGTAVDETVGVVVTDANGLIGHAFETVVVTPFIGPSAADPASNPVILVGGVTDFGIERAVSDMCAANVNRYSDRMDNYAVKQFHWTGSSAWERDFKSSGDHDAYVDNVDQVLYCGHGYGGGFTFESNHDDGTLTSNDPRISPNGDWGDRDLEWLALLSCQVLKGTYGGQSWAARWGPAFDGLHLLLGFQTNAYDWSNFAKRFAEWQTGFIKLPVRAAWFQAAATDQPSGVQSVVMGVIADDFASNYNDYFWGQGPVGPDIREPDIIGYWRVVRTNP